MTTTYANCTYLGKDGFGKDQFSHPTHGVVHISEKAWKYWTFDGKLEMGTVGTLTENYTPWFDKPENQKWKAKWKQEEALTVKISPSEYSDGDDTYYNYTTTSEEYVPTVEIETNTYLPKKWMIRLLEDMESVIVKRLKELDKK